jgi:hypothetical protein
VSAADDLAARLLASIGDAVYEDTTGFANPPPPRVSWIDLQHEVVDFVGRTPPASHLLDGGQAGGIAMCSVGPQHQLCRRWIGTSAADTIVSLVTDLGLLQLDLDGDPMLPW